MRRLQVALLAVCFWASFAGAAWGGRGTDDYLIGLESLEQGRYAEACESFTKAVDAEPENADYLLARAVSLALSDQLKPALADLKRADRLRSDHNDTRLWLASVTAMTGDFMNSSSLYPFAQHGKVYENAVREMSHAYGEVNFRKSMGDDLSVQQAMPAYEQARRQFPELARGFVERAKPKGAVSQSLRQRGIDRYNAGDFRNAYSDLLSAYTGKPDDVEVLYYLAGCRLASGAAEAARRDYTTCLRAKPDWAFAVLGRAYALAEVGDARGADWDRKRAAALRPDLDKRVLADVDTRLAKRSVSGEPVSHLEALLQAARAGKGEQELQALARRLIASTQTSRLRADERYETRRSELFLAAQRKGASAGDWADFGRFLFNEAFIVMGESVEPRVKQTPFRPHDEDRELAEAEQALDRALQLDGNHAVALAFKGGVLLKRHQNWKQADQYLSRALEMSPSDPSILALYADVMDYAAYVQSMAAASLRLVDTWEDEFYIYHRYPSQEELRRADELDRLAERMWSRARSALERAAQSEPDKPTAPFYRGVIAQRDRDFASAAKHYQQAVEMDQAYLAAWQRLSICYAAQRLTREAIEAQSRATNLVHTSAASKLKLAWLDLPRTAYETASKGVEAAAAIDPADPRVPTYYGAVARAQSNWKEAAACFLAAAVLERAHQSLRGTDLQNGQRFTAEQIARLIAYQTAAGEAMLQSKQLEKASSLLTSNFNLHANTPADQRYAFVPWALVPEVPDDPDALPYEPNIEAYVTWSALLAGRVYAQQQRYDQAAQQFEWAAGHESRKPPTMDQGMAIRIPGLWARLGLVDIALQQGRADKASFFMQNYGHPNIATAAMKEEAGRLRNALEAQDQRSGGDTYHDMLDRARRNAQ